MKKWNLLDSGCWLLAGLAFLPGCTLDEPAPSVDSPALALRFEQNLSLTVLDWDAVKVTGFKEYILLQSATGIPDNPTPLVTPDITIVKRIQDVDVTTLSVSTIVFTPQMCYKLYCAVDDRFLYSPTICVNQEISILPGFNDRACHTPGIEEFVMFDRINSYLSTCNFQTEMITHSVDESFLNFPSLELSTWNIVTNVFGYDQSPGLLRKYDYPSLTNTLNKNFSPILWSVNVHNQFVFVFTEESGKNFQVLNRSNLSMIDSRTGAGPSGVQNIAVFPGDSLTVLTLGISHSKKYTIDGNGKVAKEEDIPATISQPDLQSICAEGSEIFIAGRQGSIITRDGINAGVLSPGVNTFIMLTRLSPDEKTAVYVLNENGIQTLVFADLSNLSAIIHYKEFDIPALTVADMVVEEDIVYLIGATFLSQAQTHILKYPL